MVILFYLCSMKWIIYCALAVAAAMMCACDNSKFSISADIENMGNQNVHVVFLGDSGVNDTFIPTQDSKFSIEGSSQELTVVNVLDSQNKPLFRVAVRGGEKVKVTGDPREINKSINRLLDQVAGKPEEQLLSILAIRSMAKAVYSSTNVGHYGLAFDFYTHFTSPIRRYPDMMVHRLLDRYAKKGSRSVDVADLEDQCKHVSAQEQLATQAERASIKYKEVEYMGDRLGGVYEGHISGVTEWGIYVELDETHCEGLVGIRSLDDDFYEFDEKNYLIRGRRRNRVYQLGDPVTVQIARADLIKKQLDFVMIDDRHPAFTHRIDKQPITEQNSGIMARIAKQADAADRKSKKNGRGNTSRNYHDGAGKGSRNRKHGNPAGATRRRSSSKNKGKHRR